jgi:hypothetical protein
MGRQTLDYGTGEPKTREGLVLRGGLLLTLIVAGGLLGVRSFAVFYDIADKEPFYGCSPAQIRQMMRVPIHLEWLWPLWVVVVLTCVCARWLNHWAALILVWAACWMICLWSGINQYSSDLAVLESPNKDWIIKHGKNAKLPPPLRPGG